MTGITVQSIAGQPYRQKITARQHTFFADVPQSKGGGDTAPTPHEYMLGALGACTSMTMQMYANRKGWDLQRVNVTISETAETPAGQARPQPVLLKDIQVRGNLEANQVQMLQSIAERCPVNRFLLGDKTVSSQIRLEA